MGCRRTHMSNPSANRPHPRNSRLRRQRFDALLRDLAPSDYTGAEWLAIIGRIAALAMLPAHRQKLPEIQTEENPHENIV